MNFLVIFILLFNPAYAGECFFSFDVHFSPLEVSVEVKNHFPSEAVCAGHLWGVTEKGHIRENWLQRTIFIEAEVRPVVVWTRESDPFVAYDHNLCCWIP